jgi:hypothetical protein
MYYSILLVLHVISATLLGVYIVLPWQVKQLTSLSEERLAPYHLFYCPSLELDTIPLSDYCFLED